MSHLHVHCMSLNSYIEYASLHGSTFNLKITLSVLQEYSNKQLLALINSVDHINKKSRQRLVNIVEEMDRNRR